MKTFYFDEEHTQAFVCSRQCAEEFECEDKLSSFNLFYFLSRLLYNYNVRDDDGEWHTYLALPENEDEEYEIEESILSACGRYEDVFYFEGSQLFNDEGRYASGHNYDPGDFLEANGFDPAMADDPSFELLSHASDYIL